MTGTATMHCIVYLSPHRDKELTWTGTRIP